MMSEHEITAPLSGKGRINKPGDWEIIDLGHTTWYCSCGEEFEDIEDAWDHYEETH